MDTTPKYDRDKLVDLLSERAAFERAAVGLYDALMRGLGEIDHPLIASSMDALHRYREEEREHAEWVTQLLGKLGGTPHRDFSDAVSRETRALESVITREANRGELLPVMHAMLAAELMDAEGWKLLLKVADELGDEDAIRELRRFVEREDEHLALVRRMILALATESVRFSADGQIEAQTSGATRAEKQGTAQPGRQRHQNVMDVAISGLGRATTDHDIIRRWVEERGGKPAHVKRTGGDGDPGILRIDFPGWSGAGSLEAIDWDTWFRAFDANKLAFIYEEKTAGGEPSRFNKLVARDTVRARLAGEHDAAVHKGRTPPRRGATGRTARTERGSRGPGARTAQRAR